MWPLTSVLSLLTLLIVLYARVTQGIDITDEIQYYGEIKGLVEHGHLFTTDLFFQQTVYVLVYPIFKAYHQAMGYDGLIMFGRLTLAISILVVYLHAQSKLLELTHSRSVSSLCALALTFAVPYHGVMSPSYNTISQLLWIVYTLWFLRWQGGRSVAWTLIPVVTAFAHPTSAIAMTIMAIGRMAIERDAARIGKSVATMVATGAIVLPVALHFASAEQYRASLSFSSGYGVGDTFFNSHDGPTTLARILTLFLTITVCVRIAPSKLARPLIPILSAGLAYVLLRPFDGPFSAYSTATVKLLTILCATAYAWALSPASARARSAAHTNRTQWLMALMLGYTCTIAITSGNGIWQATGSLMVALPLLLACVLQTSPNTAPTQASPTLMAASILTVTLAILHWSAFPYREAHWWQTTHATNNIPEFRYLRTTPARAAMLAQVHDAFSAVTQGRPVLVITEYPGMYFALGARIESCMVYMHSITSETSEKRLLECMASKRPEVIVDIYASDASDYKNSRIKQLMRSVYQKYPGHCATATQTYSHGDANTPTSLTFHVCDAAVR